MSTIDEKINVKIEWDNDVLKQSVAEVISNIRSISDIRIEPLKPIIDTGAYTSVIERMLKSEIVNQIASDLADETYEILDVALSEASANLTLLENIELVDPKIIDNAKTAINSLAEQLATSGNEATKGADKWDNLNTILSKSETAFNELGKSIPGLTGEIFTGIGSIISISGEMSKSIKGVSDAVSAMDTASGVFAIISATIKAISFVSDIVKANQAANEASAKANREHAESIEELERATQIDNFDTIFGKDSFGIFKTNAAVARQELESMQSSLEKIANGGLSSDMRSGWQKFWGTKKENIHKLSYDDLLDVGGNFDGEKLRAWYEAYGNGLEKEHKEMVENLLKDWDDYTAAMDSMKDYLSGIFSDTASTIADKMIEAFIKTGNAVTDLTDLTQDLAKTLAKNSVVEYLTEFIFNEDFGKLMSTALSKDNISEATRLFDERLNLAENWMATSGNDFLKGIFGLSGNQEGLPESAENRTVETKGIAQASQESVDELNGRMTAMQSHTFSLMENTKILVDNSASMLEKLCNIDFNTARLSAIEKDMHNISAFVNQVTVQGLKIAM